MIATRWAEITDQTTSVQLTSDIPFLQRFYENYLCQDLYTNTSITHLDVSGQSIMYDGHLNKLLDALKMNTSVTTLVFRNDGVSDDHLRDILELLQVNSTITSLDVQDNRIKLERVQLDSLRDNTTLTTLNMNGNKIGSRGMKRISDVLYHNTTLKRVSVSANPYYAFGAGCLLRAAMVHPTLCFLDMVSHYGPGKLTCQKFWKHNTTNMSIDAPLGQLGYTMMFIQTRNSSPFRCCTFVPWYEWCSDDIHSYVTPA